MILLATSVGIQGAPEVDHDGDEGLEDDDGEGGDRAGVGRGRITCNNAN